MNKLITYTSTKYELYINDTNKPSLLYILSKLYHAYPLYDRFLSLNIDYEFILSDSKKESITDIYSSPYHSFEECCFLRSSEIISLSNTMNKDIWISYSGGVDSTTVVCSFLLNPKLNKNKFHVLYNKYSISEYPNFFNLLMRNKINLVNTNENIDNIFIASKNGILVTGMCGDQLDGSNLLTRRFTNINPHSNWIDFFGNISLDRIHTIRKYDFFDEYVDIIKNYSKNFIDDLTNVSEFTWLFNFCCKWLYVKEYMKLLNNTNYNIFPFFDTIYFQKWCLSSIKEKFLHSQRNPEYYKIEWKKLIYKYTKDIDYVIYKKKDSTYLNIKDVPSKLGILTEKGYHIYENITKEELLKLMSTYSTKKLSIKELL